MTLNSKETLLWLKKLVNSVGNKSKQDPATYVDLAEKIADLDQAVENAKTISEPTDRQIKKQSTSKDDFLPNLCQQHPTYNAAKPPRIDCEGHWAAYKKMNPNEYAAARRKYERNKKASS